MCPLALARITIKSSPLARSVGAKGRHVKTLAKTDINKGFGEIRGPLKKMAKSFENGSYSDK